MDGVYRRVGSGYNIWLNVLSRTLTISLAMFEAGHALLEADHRPQEELYL